MSDAPHLLEARDKLGELLSLIEAIRLMANGLDGETANAFQRVAEIARKYALEIDGMLDGDEEAADA